MKEVTLTIPVKTNNVPVEPEASTCSECGEQVESIIGCPDGAEVCQQCFDAGSH